MKKEYVVLVTGLVVILSKKNVNITLLIKIDGVISITSLYGLWKMQVIVKNILIK